MKIIFFDLETTGTNPAVNAIHQMSGKVLIDGREAESFNYRLRPFDGAVIEPKALEVSGVTEEQIMAYPPMNCAYQSFIQMLGKYVDKYDRSDKFFLAGYNNISFDNQFLRELFIRNNDKYFGSWFWPNSIDIMPMATFLLMDRRPHMENFKLSTVAQELGITIDQEKLHDAMYDIELTIESYLRIENILRTKPQTEEQPKDTLF